MPEKSVAFGKFYFCVGNGSLAVRAPVNNTLSTVDKALFIKADKHFTHCLGAAFIKCKALAVPVAGTAALFKLLHNAPAIFFPPLPCTVKKSLAPDLFLGKALFPHGFNDFCLRCNGSMVGARHPEGRVTLHPAPANQDILQRFIKCMAHMKLACDVWRRHYDSIWPFLGITFRVKVFPVKPELVNPVFHFSGIINFS